MLEICGMDNKLKNDNLELHNALKASSDNCESLLQLTGGDTNPAVTLTGACQALLDFIDKEVVSDLQPTKKIQIEAL